MRIQADKEYNVHLIIKSDKDTEEWLVDKLISDSLKEAGIRVVQTMPYEEEIY